MFKQLIALAMVAVVAQAKDEPPKEETFADVVNKLPSIHFTGMPGPAMPGLYSLVVAGKFETDLEEKAKEIKEKKAVEKRLAEEKAKKEAKEAAKKKKEEDEKEE